MTPEAQLERAPLRILLIDDHAVVRAGYRRLLESSPHLRVVGEAEDGESGYQRYVEASFDIVILDLSLPGRSGLETLRRLLARDSDACVLVFSMHEEPAFVERALAAGARGFITKSSPPDILVQAVEAVARGERYLSDDVAQRLAMSRVDESQRRLATLSAREFEVFRLLAEGKTVADIAANLALSSKTVANYATQVRTKLQINSTAALTRLAIQHGLVRP